MYNNGLVFVTSSFALSHIQKLLKFAASFVNKQLYVAIYHADANTAFCSHFANVNVSEGVSTSSVVSNQNKTNNDILSLSTSAYTSYVKTCYAAAAEIALDVRLLLPPSFSRSVSDIKSSTSTRHCDVLILDCPHLDDSIITQHVSPLLKSIPNTVVHFPNSIQPTSSSNNRSNIATLLTYDYVALGGTFDRLHSGHKVLLSLGALLSDKMLTVGITSDSMLKSKLLSQLIEPLQKRCLTVTDFLKDVKPDLDYHIVPLQDPYGPPIHDARYQCIIASPETVPGCDKINSIRQESNMPTLVVHTIDFVESPLAEGQKSLNSEHLDELFCEGMGPVLDSKISSSAQRVSMLGRLLKPVCKRSSNVNQPYIIGLTGGIASGKSSIAQRIAALGAQNVDCDKLGHAVYASPHSACYQAIVKAFGNDILAADSTQELPLIDRSKLGPIVFADPGKMKLLTDLVWPEILKSIQEIISNARVKNESTSSEAEKCKVVVLEAAVLLDGGWDSLCDEVWVSIISRGEAIKRLGTRNKLSEEQASIRVNATPWYRDGESNNLLQNKAHVVLSSEWEPEYTQKQVEKAWKGLLTRLQ